MKITYLGTAAAEGMPAVFCNCEFCREARRIGGKNIRTRSQSLINDNLLIDFPADTYYHFLQNGVRADEIEYMLVTHAHRDHFYPGDLSTREAPYAHNMKAPTLKVFCPKTVCEKMPKDHKNVEVTELEAYKTVKFGEYSVTALPARHMTGSVAFIYIIKADKTLLYAHDTGYFFDEVFDYIEKEKIVFDMVSLDCTYVDIPISDDGSHMGFPNIERLLNRLTQIHAINDSTLKYVNHFSHNGNPLQHVLEKRAEEYGMLVSYDGCNVEF